MLKCVDRQSWGPPKKVFGCDFQAAIMTEHNNHWGLQYHLAHVGVLCLGLCEDTHTSFSHLLWQAASCVRVSNLSEQHCSPINHLITHSNMFVDENDALHLFGSGYSGRISECRIPSPPPPDLASHKKKEKKNTAGLSWHFIAAPFVCCVPFEDGPWWAEALSRVFRCCTTKSMIRKRHSVTWNVAVRAGHHIGTPATVFNMIKLSQMNSEVIDVNWCVWHETYTQEPR